MVVIAKTTPSDMPAGAVFLPLPNAILNESTKSFAKSSLPVFPPELTYHNAMFWKANVSVSL
jgi:hypothetical protein